MDVASKYQNVESKEHAVYVCGTSALIHVIQEALVRDRYLSLRGTKNQLTKEKIRKEVDKAKNTFRKYEWPTIDVTRKSVEETAASIIKIHEIYKENG